MPNIRISGIIEESIVDGPGLRYVIFFQGCNINCYNCHNKHTWDINGGYLIDSSQIINSIKNNPLLQGITLTGGEALLQKDNCLFLIEEAKKLNLDVILYTGRIYEDLKSLNDSVINQILDKIDYLVDGPYIDEIRSLTLYFRGSSNQRFIDINKTKEKGTIILKYND
jgi:anaerobic ribonucleoside-triphosphate reductase activating protein